MNQKPDGRVIVESWVQNISSAIQTFFDCKTYTTRRTFSIDWTFCGIATNTVAAAMAFEMVHKLVQDWSSRRKGNKNSYRLGVAKGLCNTAHREKDDEERRVREQEAQELATKEAVEKRKRQEEIDRLSGNVYATQADRTSSSTPSEGSLRVKIEEETEVTIKNELVENSSGLPKMPSEVMRKAYEADDDNTDDDLEGTNDSESDYGETDTDSDIDNTYERPDTTFDEDNELVVDLTANFDDELKRHMPKQESLAPENADATPSPYPEDQNSKDKQSGMLWRNAGALVHFRENAQKAAQNYLETQKVILRTDHKRTNYIRDWNAYQAGQEDSKKIDVKRRRIEG